MNQWNKSIFLIGKYNFSIHYNIVTIIKSQKDFNVCMLYVYNKNVWIAV